MPDRPLNPESEDDTNAGQDNESTAGMPHWVKVLGIVALIVLLLFVILHLAFGGFGGHTSR